MKYKNVANHVFNQPWAIHEDTLRVIGEVLRYRMTGGKYSPDEIAERVGDREHPEPFMVAYEAAEPRGNGQPPGAIAVLPLYGIISQRMNMLMEMSGGTSTEMFAKMFQQMVNDPNVGAIVLDVDSPGGSVFGVEELAAQISKARSQKRIIAVANSLMASAAYWIGTAADEVWVTPGGIVGSVGVYSMHVDYSKQNEMMGVKPTYIYAGKYKVEGNPDEPLTDEAKAEEQRLVDSYYEAFTKAVAKQRGVSVAKARGPDFGQGRLFRAQEAVAAGMADRVGTLDDALASLKAGASMNRGAAMGGVLPEALPVMVGPGEQIGALADEAETAEPNADPTDPSGDRERRRRKIALS
jgi:signal peptide peptidase SppA